MKKLNLITLGLLMAASSTAFAAEGSSAVHFNGEVTEPTCSADTEKQDVNLATVGAAAFEGVNIGQTIEAGAKDFNIHIKCEAKDLANHIKIKMLGDVDPNQATALKNSSNSNGVGLEVFYNNEVLAPNTEFDAAKISGMNNEGDNTIPMMVRYARVGDQVTGGSVTADVTFVTEYR